MGCKKQGAKKQGHCYSKREEAPCSLFLSLFLSVCFHAVSNIWLEPT